MSEAHPSNFQCQNCGAKLLLKRHPEPKKLREESLCPYCLINLPPRDGKETLQYILAEAPLPRKRLRDANLAKKAAAFVTWKKI